MKKTKEQKQKTVGAFAPSVRPSTKVGQNKGITLIALVITIIVMLILVAVTISMAVNGGLFEYASKAGAQTNAAIANEQELGSGKVTIGNTVYNSIDEYLDVEEKPTIKNYVGCYADINDDGTPDGIIYADLAFSVSGAWDDGVPYEYSAKNNLKSYYTKETDYDKGEFGTEDMIAPISGTTGNDRFYIMALENVTTDEYSTFYWYREASGKLDRAVDYDYNDFGEGKNNTIAMINDWNNKTYGNQNPRDLWGIIQNSEKYDIVEDVNDSGKWFVPSKSELSAFEDYLNTKLGVYQGTARPSSLNSNYWSSSQESAEGAWTDFPLAGYIDYGGVVNNEGIRLSATF